MIRLTVYKTASLLDTSSETFISVFFHLVEFWLEPIPAATEREAGYIQDRSPIYHRAKTETDDHSQSYPEFI